MRQVRWHACLGTCRHLQALTAEQSRPLNQPTLARRHATCTHSLCSYGTCLESGAQAAAARSHRPSNTTVLHLAAFVPQTQQGEDTNQRPSRGTQSLARPAVSLFNGCSVLSFSRSRVAVVCLSGLRERPGGFVSAHPHPHPLPRPS